MTQKTVLVTGIGGNVAQGILRNIQSLKPSIRLVGTNTRAVSGGNHLCDVVHEVPFSTSALYLPEIVKICELHDVDLIIPSTDLESLCLAAHLSDLPRVATSPHQTNQIFTDKYLTAQHFLKHDISFASSSLPSQFTYSCEQWIAKPRLGRGSRDLHLNPKNCADFDDAHYIIQELYQGIEITTAFYVTLQGVLHGHITLLRELQNGATSACYVVREYDLELSNMISRLMETLPIRGSCNLQSIVTTDGRIIPFEVNGRISGTNSIRAQFGFNDVEYTIEEYLYDRPPATPKIDKGVAIRILMDVIYPGLNDFNEIKNRNTRHYLS